MSNSSVDIQLADYDNPRDAQAVLNVLDTYAQDPMGLQHPLPDRISEQLISKLKAFPTAFSVLAWKEDRPVGLANCVLGFSTFSACRLINIHDLAVVPNMRGHGIGQLLLDFISEEAIRRDCCKITLEVRVDNPARRLYKRNGFKADDPPFEYWTKEL
jgi:ribosomal protein S18 acetylase RimI-like enzyme